MTTLTDPPLGRKQAASLLSSEVDRSTASHGGLVLVTGEAGIGKTTLVTGAVREARARGALVLTGSCWDSAHAPGYWPWVQVVRGLRRALPQEEYRSSAPQNGGLAALLGEAGGETGVGRGSDEDVFALYDAVTTALVSAAQGRPVLVVLEDLHWADEASLRLLEFVVRHSWFERLLVVGTYRDVEVEIPADAARAPDADGAAAPPYRAGARDGVVAVSSGRPDRDAVPAARTVLPMLHARATTITLTGLDRDDVGTLLARAAGREPSAELATRVHQRTGGNPFFVEQAARLWASGGPALAMTPGVSDALTRRISLLPSPVRRLLEAASVLGREFTRPVLASVVAAPSALVDALLDQAVTGRLVTAAGGGRFCFAHDLFREALYEGLTADAARRHHAAVVRAVRVPGDEGLPAIGPADLARHAYLAGGDLPAGTTVELLTAAAEDAGNRVAGDEATRHLRRAYDVARAAPPEEVDPGRTVAVALDLVGQLGHTAERDEVIALYRGTAELALTVADPELLARVALALHAGSTTFPELAATGERLLRQAHRALVGQPDGSGPATDPPPGRHTPRDDPGPASATGQPPATGPAPADRSAGASPSELTALADELTLRTMALARSGGDDTALEFLLWARHEAIWGLGSAAERERLMEELLAVLSRTGNRGMHLVVRSLRWVAQLEQGNAAYREHYLSYLAAADAAGLPHLRPAVAVDRSIIGALRGEFAEAEHRLELASELPGAQSDWNFMTTFMAVHHRTVLEMLQGRTPGDAELRARLTESGYPYPDVLLGIAAFERGDVEEGLLYTAAARGRSSGFPRDLGPLWLRLRAQAAAAAGDRELGEEVRRALTPHPEAWLVSFCGCDISGPVPFWLGVVEAGEGRWDEAVAALTDAVVAADRLEARPWAVLARARLASALYRRDGSGDATGGGATGAVPGGRAGAHGGAGLLGGAGRDRDRAARLRQDAERLAAGMNMSLPPGHAGAPRSASAPRAAPSPVPDSAHEPSPPPAAVEPVPSVARAGDDVSGARARPPGRSPEREFRHDGAVWQLTFGGRTAHLPDAKGLRDLHLLLSHPGEAVPAVRLLSPEGGATVVAAHTMGGDEVLDERARAAYKRRLAALDGEIDRAALLGDDDRAAELDREREALLVELRAAAGLAGRSRRLGDSAERARKTVTARIRDTFRRLDVRHPELAAHLRATVSTGARCCYRPPDHTPWRL
ncbi:AAA family ATPase [Streptomyces spiramenti]|uniref:AAA family ATPase n=1 Tax=Streptomyces spiramenti TaxID=2720606 RepID=A0ABX1AH10_9ACTN|nr:AAA family ATPase [Streptomyces spiramenti]